MGCGRWCDSSWQFSVGSGTHAPRRQHVHPSAMSASDLSLGANHVLPRGVSLPPGPCLPLEAERRRPGLFQRVGGPSLRRTTEPPHSSGGNLVAWSSFFFRSFLLPRCSSTYHLVPLSSGLCSPLEILFSPAFSQDSVPPRMLRPLSGDGARIAASQGCHLPPGWLSSLLLAGEGPLDGTPRSSASQTSHCEAPGPSPSLLLTQTRKMK